MTDSTQRPLSWRRILFRRGVLPLVGVAVLSIAVLGLFLQSGPFADTLTDNSRAACRARPIIAIDRSGSDLKATKGATPPDTAQLQIVSLDNAYRPKPLRPNQAVTVELEIDRSSSANVPADVRLPTLTVPVPNGATSAMTGLFTPGSPVTPDSDKYLVVKVKPGDGYRVIGNTGSSQYVNSVTITVHPATTTVSVTITSPTKDQVFTAHGNPPEAAMTYTVEATAINGHLKRVSLSVYNISLQQEVYYVESTNQFTARGTPLGVGDYTATAMATATASTGGDQWATAVVYFRVVASTSPPPVSWRSGATKVLTALGSLVHGALASFTVHAAGADCGTLEVTVTNPADVKIANVSIKSQLVREDGGLGAIQTEGRTSGNTGTLGMLTVTDHSLGTYNVWAIKPGSQNEISAVARVTITSTTPGQVTLILANQHYEVTTVSKVNAAVKVYGVEFAYRKKGTGKHIGTMTGSADSITPAMVNLFVAPGEYQLAVSNKSVTYPGSDGRQYQVDKSDLGPPRPGLEREEKWQNLPNLVADTIQPVTIRLVPVAKTYELTVRVNKMERGPACGAKVYLKNNDDVNATELYGLTGSGLEGAKFSGLLPGSYTARADPAASDTGVCFIDGLLPSNPLKVVITPDQPPLTVNLELISGARLRGGMKLGGARSGLVGTVTLKGQGDTPSPQEDTVQLATTLAAYTFSGLAPGSYILTGTPDINKPGNASITCDPIAVTITNRSDDVSQNILCKQRIR